MPHAPKPRHHQFEIREEIAFRFTFTRRQQVDAFTRLELDCAWVICTEYVPRRPHWRVSVSRASLLWPPDFAVWQTRLSEQARAAGGRVVGWSMSREMLPNTALEPTRWALSVLRCGLPPFGSRRSRGSAFGR